MSKFACGICSKEYPDTVVPETHLEYHYKHLLDNHFWYFMKMIWLRDKKWKKLG